MKKFQNILTQNLVSNFFVMKFCFVSVKLVSNTPTKKSFFSEAYKFVEIYQGGRESLLIMPREARGYIKSAQGVLQKFEKPLL